MIFRWLVLASVALAVCGNYFIYDIIPISGELLADQLGFTDAQIGTLQFWYSAVNVVLVLIGGIIIDKIGTRRTMLIFTAIFALGAGITALKGDFVTMAVGRLIFGVGAETMIIAVSASITKWFKGSFISLAMGLELTIARLGSFTSENAPTWGASMFDDWQKPLIFATFVGVFSLLMAFCYWILDKYGERKYMKVANVVEEKQDEIKLRDILSFDKSLIYVSILCLVFYSGIFPFITFAPRFFIAHHGVTLANAGKLISIITFAAMVLTPILGGLIDKVGRRASMMVLGCIMMMPVYLIMAYTHSDITLGGETISLVIPMIMLGLAFSLVPSAMWPCVPIIVQDGRVGTAFGFMTMLQNFGLMAFNWIIGQLNESTGGYESGMWVFTSLGFIGVVFSALLIARERGIHKHGVE